jgi:hypothetical protein
MERVVVPAAVLLTTFLIYRITQMLRRRPLDASARAASAMFECVGACVLFLALNTGFGVGLVLLARWAGSTFVSLYSVGDVTLVVLSVFQGLFFRFWWRG